MGHIYRYNNNKNNNISKSVCKTSVNESFGVGAYNNIYIAFTGRKEKVTATYFFLLYRFLYLCVCVL